MKGSAAVTLRVLPSHALWGPPASSGPPSAPAPPPMGPIASVASPPAAPPAPELVPSGTPPAPKPSPPCPEPPDPVGPSPIDPVDAVVLRAPPVAGAAPKMSSALPEQATPAERPSINKNSLFLLTTNFTSSISPPPRPPQYEAPFESKKIAVKNHC